jgi:hypothetical protein
MGADWTVRPSLLRGGQVTILVGGIMVVFLLLFFVVGMDFARVYYVRGELQAAADSAALAGVKALSNPSGPGTILLDSGTNYQQLTARQTAWQFACRNRAAHQNVFLEQMGSCNPASDATCCNTAPPSGLNEGTNDTAGDIVVGYWSSTPTACSSTGTTGQFCPANGNTGHPINAVRVRDQRVAGLEGSGRGSVGLLFGKLVGWSTMDVRRAAIAALPPSSASVIALCASACTNGAASCLDLNSPCVFDPVRVFSNGPCDSTNCFDSSGNPIACGCSTGVAWTTLLENPTSTPALTDIICGGQRDERVCGRDIWTSMGTVSTEWGSLKSLMYDPLYDSEQKTCESAIGAVVPCNSSAYSVKNWWITVPITQSCPPGQQGNAWDPKPVFGYAQIRVVAICSPGSAGGCSGHNIHENVLSPSVCGGGDKTVVMDQIACVSCSDAEQLPGNKPILVK